MNTKQSIKCAGLAVAALLTAGVMQVSAFTVAWDASSTTELTLQGGTTGLPIGSLVQIGNFGATPDGTIIALGANPAALQAAFQAWGSTTVGSGTDGTAVGTFVATTTKAGTGFFTETAYLLVFNAATSAGASQVAVIKGSLTPANGDPWQFPATDVATPPTFNLDGLAGAAVMIGAYSTASFASPWWGENVNAFSTAAVPEPSTVMLVGVGLLGLVGIVRRRRS